jgi:hypothetical protein
VVLRGRGQAGYSLLPGGKYVGLYRTTDGVSSQFRYTHPADGAWTYRRISSDTAELILLPDSSDPTQTAAVRQLRVSTESGGSFIGGGSTIQTSEGDSFGAFMQGFRLARPGAQMPITNSSNRSFIRAGSAGSVGFVIADQWRAVLVRAVGPGLAIFGVQGTLADPRLVITPVVRTATDTQMENDDWGAEARGSASAIERAGQMVGAFPLAADSKDAAIVVVLNPGGYTVQVTGSSSADLGEVLIEIYVLP